MKKFLSNILYFLRCWFVQNPNNPLAPRLLDLKPGTKITIYHGGAPMSSYVIKRVFLKFNKIDGELDFKAQVVGNPYKEEIYLADAGVVPYVRGWNEENVPYLS